MQMRITRFDGWILESGKIANAQLALLWGYSGRG